MVCEPGSRSDDRDRVALGHRGQVDLAVGQLGLGVVLALDVGPEEPGELDDLARGGELRLAAGAARPVRAEPTSRTWALVPVASAICEATVRFQMRS